MGLLDFDNEQMRLGMGLLAAGGARSDGANTGQRLMEALGSVDQWKQGKQKQKLADLQLLEAEQSIAQKKLTMENLREGLAMLNPPKAQARTGQLGSGSFGIMPTEQGQPEIPQAQSQSSVIASWRPEQVMAYERLTGQKITDLWAKANEGFKREPGAVYRTPGGGVDFGPPAIEKNTQLSSDGRGGYRVSPVSGALETISALTGATEGAKAGFDLVEIPDGNGGTQKMPRSQAVKLLGGGDRTSLAPAGYASEPQMRTTASGNMGADPQAFQREIARSTAELQKLMDPESRKLLTDHIEEMKRQAGNIPPSSATPAPASTPPRWGASLTPEQLAENEAAKVKAVEQVKADISPTQGRQANIDAAQNALSLIDRVMMHPGLKTATGLSGKIDPRNYIPGTDATNFSVLTEQLKSGAFLTAYAQLRGGGAITEAEGAKATSSIARMNQAQSETEFKAALEDYRAVIKQGLKRMGVENTGGASGDFDAPPSNPAGRVVDTLPPANASNRGQRIRDTTTGKILTSNGMQWKAE